MSQPLLRGTEGTRAPRCLNRCSRQLTVPQEVRAAGPAGPALGGGGSPSAGAQLWTATSAPAHWLAPPGGRPLARQSVCELEVDACADAILNRAEVCP